MRRRAAPLLALLALFAGCFAPDVTPPGPSNAPSVEPAVSFEAIRFETDRGPLTVLLYPEAAPRTVAHMKTLVREGYYAGREFNRAVPGHVIQVVDKATGATDDLRTLPLEITPGYHFSAGATGIARADNPDSGGPEFFIMDFATSHLDGNYTVWGQVADGLAVVHRAARVDTVRFDSVPGANLLADRVAVTPVKILRADITQLEIPADRADDYPLQLALNQREGNFRHSLDWPEDLRVGAEAALTWYVRPYDDSRTPSPVNLKLAVDGQELLVFEDPDAPGAYHWTWTPSRSGVHGAGLLDGGRVRATLQILVGD